MWCLMVKNVNIYVYRWLWDAVSSASQRHDVVFGWLRVTSPGSHWIFTSLGVWAWIRSKFQQQSFFFIHFSPSDSWNPCWPFWLCLFGHFGIFSVFFIYPLEVIDALGFRMASSLLLLINKVFERLGPPSFPKSWFSTRRSSRSFPSGVKILGSTGCVVGSIARHCPSLWYWLQLPYLRDLSQFLSGELFITLAVLFFRTWRF